MKTHFRFPKSEKINMEDLTVFFRMNMLILSQNPKHFFFFYY